MVALAFFPNQENKRPTIARTLKALSREQNKANGRAGMARQSSTAGKLKNRIFFV